MNIPFRYVRNFRPRCVEASDRIHRILHEFLCCLIKIPKGVRVIMEVGVEVEDEMPRRNSGVYPKQFLRLGRFSACRSERLVIETSKKSPDNSTPKCKLPTLRPHA